VSDKSDEVNYLKSVTTSFNMSDNEKSDVLQCLSDVCSALSERGYNPVSQMVGYIISGDPVYITSHRSARERLSVFSREELLTSLVRFF